MNENEEFEFRARAENETAQKQMGGKPPLGFVAKQIWGMMPQNPKNQVQNLPMVGGALGGASPIPGGTFMGTALGQGARDAILKTMGSPIPSGWQHAGELGTAAFSDVVPIPFAKKAYFGKQIGEAEKAAGMANIAKEAPPSGARTAVKFVQSLKDKMNSEPITAEEARAAKPALDFIHQKGWLQGTEYSADLAKISERVRDVVNTIPGRAAPAEAMRAAMTIPRFVGNVYNAIPPNIRRGIGYGAGVGIGGGTGYELIRKLMGG